MPRIGPTAPRQHPVIVAHRARHRGCAATPRAAGRRSGSEFQHAKADHDFVEEELELKTNTELTRAIHILTIDIHRKLLAERATVGVQTIEEPHQ